MPPYSASFRYVPEAGHQLEVRQALEDAAWRFQTGRLRISVISELAGRDQSALTGFIQFETLGEYHEFLREPNEHQIQASESLQARLRGLVRESTASILDIVMPLESPLRRQGYAQIVSRTALPGRSDELIRLTLDLGRMLRSQGHNVAVSTQLAGPNAGESALTTGFATLEEWETFRQRTAEDADLRKTLDLMLPLLAGPPIVTLYSIVIPAPPRDHTYSDA